MIDINLHHADLVMWPFNEEVAEHYGYLEELSSLDLKTHEQALYAIRKWLLPDRGWSEMGTYLRQEAIRYRLTKEQAFGNVWLPGIDGTDFSDAAMAVYKIEFRKFHLLLWNELFPNTLFVPADLSQYRQRVDHQFMACPDAPQEWGAPEYKQWT
jgi:hypothetical protein